MGRIALCLAYNGANYNGWQTQPGGNTVQDYLQHAIAQFLDIPSASTICAGRTDTGVHALQQIVHIDTDVYRKQQSWVRGLNAILPVDIRVQWACPVDQDFHARFGATERTYYYVLKSSAVSPAIGYQNVGWVHYELDDAAMRAAAQHLIGTHDFSSFRSSQCQAASPVRTLFECQIERRDQFILFSFKANAFLHHMVRNLMGTLLIVGRGNKSADWAKTILAAKNRQFAAPTFMANGLYLAHVNYPDAPYLPVLDARSALFSHLGMV